MKVPQIRLSLQKPKKLVYDGPKMQLLRREQGKAVLYGEASLRPEYGPSSRSRSVVPIDAFFFDVFK
jgi:hypothetical protein